MIVRYIEANHININSGVDAHQHKGSDKQLIVYNIKSTASFPENASPTSYYELIANKTGAKIIDIQNVKIRQSDGTDLPYSDFKFYIENNREVRLHIPTGKSIPADTHIIITLIMGV